MVALVNSSLKVSSELFSSDLYMNTREEAMNALSSVNEAESMRMKDRNKLGLYIAHTRNNIAKESKCQNTS